MDNQPIIPTSSGPFSSAPSGSGRGPLFIALIVVLGLGTIIFGVLTVTFSNKAAATEKSTTQQKAAAAAAARDEQKSLDHIEFTKINETPYRAYNAPQQFGSFVINFPKNWSSSVREQNSGTQVSLALNPEFIRNSNGQDEITAIRVLFMTTPQSQYMAQYAGNIKNGKMKQAKTTVSGQPAYDVTGTFSGRKTIREVIVPVRDKVLVFSSESPQYAAEFNAVLSQAKIIP